MSMGVYIKDMEMPKNCYNCWLGHKCPKYEVLLWNEIDKKRKADCPLIEVPGLHERLINAELEKIIDRNQDWLNK